MDKNGSTGLYSGVQPSLTPLSASRWAAAEDEVAELLQRIQPSRISDERRVAVIEYMKELVKIHFGHEVFSFGSMPLKTYLSDGDIDLTAFGPSMDRTVANHLCAVLQMEEKNIEARFKVKEVQCINAEVEVVKCLVEDIIVDISFNQLGGLCTLCFLEEVDQMIGQNHLFKRSIILVKAWCYYESRILGAHCSLISTYALETMVLYIFHLFYSSLRGPLEVLFHFLEFFSNFDWDHYGLSLWGPVPLTDLQKNASSAPQNIQLPLGSFLYNCSIEYAAYLEGLHTQGKHFSPKFLNIIDPLRTGNNLGRSVNKGNLCRIRSAFSLGAKQLEKILTGPEQQLCEKLKAFFQSTEKHGCKQNPPVSGNDCNQQLDVESELNDDRVTEPASRYNRKKIIHGQSNADAVGIQKLNKETLDAFLYPFSHVRTDIDSIAIDDNAGWLSESPVEKLYSDAELNEREAFGALTLKLEKTSLGADETFHTSRQRGKGAQAKNNAIDFELHNLAVYSLNCRDQLDNTRELSGDYCISSKDVTENPLAASSDLRTEYNLESHLPSEDADGSSIKGNPLHEDINKAENRLLTPLMDGDKIEVNVRDSFLTLSQESVQIGDDNNQFNQQPVKVANGTAYNLERNTMHLSVGSDKPLAGCLEANTTLLHGVSHAAANQVPGSPFSDLDDNKTVIQRQVSDVCRVGCNQLQMPFQYHLENQLNCENMSFTAISSVSEAAFLSQKTVHIPPGYYSSLTDLKTHSTSDSSATNLSSSESCLPICNLIKDENILLKLEMFPNSSQKLTQQMNVQELNGYIERDAVRNSIQMNEESGSEFSCICSRDLIDDLHSSDAETVASQSQLRDNLTDTSETEISGTTIKKSTFLDQLELSHSNGFYEAPIHGSEVMPSDTSQCHIYSDKFDSANYDYCLPASWNPFKTQGVCSHVSPLCTMTPQKMSEMRSCENLETPSNVGGIFTVPVSTSQYGAVAEVENGDLQEDILKGDLKTYQYHLQVGHILMSPSSLHFASPILGMPNCNQGKYFWDHPRHVTRSNIPDALHHSHQFGSAAHSTGVNAHKSFFLRNGYFGEDVSRPRKGMGSNFPNLRQNYVGRQAAGRTKGQLDLRNHNEAVHGDAVRFNFHESNDHKGTHVFVPNYSHSGHVRLNGKGYRSLERNYYGDKAGVKHLDIQQAHRFQNNSIRITSAKSNRSSPLSVAGGITFEDVTHIPFTADATISTDASSQTFATQKFKFGSLSFDSRTTWEETRKGSLVIGCTDSSSSKLQSARQREHVAERSSKQKSSSQTSYEMKQEDFPPLSCGHHGRARNFCAEKNTSKTSNNEAC